MTPDAEATLSRARQWLGKARMAHESELRYEGDRLISDLLSLCEALQQRSLKGDPICLRGKESS